MKALASLLLLLATGSACAAQLTATRTATLREAQDDITAAALNRDYQLVKIQPVDSAMAKRGYDDPGVRILFIGNSAQMARAQAVDEHLLTLLPLRLTLQQAGESVSVSSDDLAHWIEEASKPEAKQMLEDWQRDLQAILDEYASRR